MPHVEEPPAKQAKVDHSQKPCTTAFDFNVSRTPVATEAELQRIYDNDLKSFDPQFYVPSSLQGPDIPQMVECRSWPAAARGQWSSLATKRDHAQFLEEEDETNEESHPSSSQDANQSRELTCPVESSLSNPFAEYATNLGLKLQTQTVSEQRKGVVNGYLKFVFNISQPEKNVFDVAPDVVSNFGQTTFGAHHYQIPTLNQKILNLPRAFATHNLDTMDQHFLRFYLTAFCRGRTLLPKTNLWLRDVAPIAAKHDLVKHALLALAAGYWLHFNPNDEILARANNHYRMATKLLTDEINNPESRKVGKEDAVVAAMLLLFIHDAVNFELRRDKHYESRWRAGARTARWILTHSDPGQRYWKPANVQCNTARISNTNYVCFVEILAQPVTRLRLEETDDLFPWLLQGTEKESRQIHGGTGMCPKLLHIYAQITSLCTRMAMQPDSIVLPHGGQALLEMLTNFRQTSDMSDGYPTTEALLRSCSLDKDGKVACKIKVTELTAEAWVATAKIYLLCRFFRKPRSHPDVRAHLNTLIKCISWCPCQGKLFTSQSPFFCIFILCMIAENEVDRRAGREWFDMVTGDSNNRSSVPPVWEAVKRMWNWFDTEFVEEEYDDELPIGKRQAWWEEVVAMLVETEGEIALY